MDSRPQPARFDWYAATIVDDPRRIAELLARELDCEVVESKGLHGYGAGFELVRELVVRARIIYGSPGMDPTSWTWERGVDRPPHAWASGDDTEPFVAAVRAHWPAPQHWVTRADVAYDWPDGEPWGELYPELLAVADGDYETGSNLPPKPLTLRTVGDWVRELEGFPGGRTLYVGAPSSPVSVRMYEKGKQLRAAFPDRADDFPLDWVRVELQLRPQKAARQEVAALDPAELWGTSAWARAVHQRIVGEEPDVVVMQHKTPPDDERAMRFLVRQYGPLLRREAARIRAAEPELDAAGVWALLGMRLGGLIE